MRAILLVLLLAVNCFGQETVKLSQQIEQTWVGFDNPRVVNGNVVTGPMSKPQLASTSMRIARTGGDEYKWKDDIDCDRIPTLESIDLLPVEGGYAFPVDTLPGSYRITLRLTDPVLPPVKKRLMVDLKPIDPFTPIVPDLQGMPADARRGIIAMVQAMAKDMTVIADGIKSKTLKNHEDIKVLNKKQDEASRAAFKESMRVIMEPVIGNNEGPLVPEAESVFRNLSIGFGSVK